MVPIPEGVETSEEEPPDENFYPGVRGSGGSSTDESIRSDRFVLSDGAQEDELRG